MSSCESTCTIVGSNGSRIVVTCELQTGHYIPRKPGMIIPAGTRHIRYIGGSRDAEITWEDE